jgi:DNA-binding transcriptional ArsR family regulator
MVDSAEALKALADPLRLKLLHLMMGSLDRAWSVKELAGELKQPVTKLYHHIKLLESAALITDVESRLVSGTVEHRYRASQRSLRMDDEMFTAPETRDDSIAQVAALVDTSRDALLDYLHGDYAEADEVLVSRSTARPCRRAAQHDADPVPPAGPRPRDLIVSRRRPRPPRSAPPTRS